MLATEQRANIKFCILLHKSPPATLRMFEDPFGRAAIKKTQIHEWHKRLDVQQKTAGLFCVTAHLHISRWWSESTLPSIL
jgi:hypothetical protein